MSEKQEKTLLDKNFKELVRQQSQHEDSQCGFSIFRRSCLQKLASKKLYVITHGMISCFLMASYTYYTGTITTMEKRYKIPSQNIGMIMSGSNVASCIMAPILSHYLSRKHRPRWMSLGILSFSIYCFLTAALHFIYGPGEDALSLTVEYGASLNISDADDDKTVCRSNITEVHKKLSESNFVPQFYLFGAKVFSGLLGPVFTVLGISYMDDNMQKSKTPIMISFSFFMGLMGPAIGATIASLCLKQYIDPKLTPIISPGDSRWLGAWWVGWIIIGAILVLLAFPIALFPKELPRAAVRRMISMESQKQNESDNCGDEIDEKLKVGMTATFKRILTNKIFMLNNVSGVFYMFGFFAYWLYMPKYIETQYRKSASFSNFLTGSVSIIFTALGIVVSGLVISKYKPNARYMAAWNVFCGVYSVFTIVLYTGLGCDANDHSIVLTPPDLGNSTSCISNCHCDFVKYSPVCGEDGNTYISPCHAGCTEPMMHENGTKYYENCGCIFSHQNNSSAEEDFGGFANPGACPVNCNRPLFLFMIAMCINSFIGSTGRSSNFLIGVRCVKPEDKAVSMGIERTIQGLFAFAPSPIVFGWIIDQTCTVWGKTSSGTGNCWLYDGESFRLLLNYTAGIFVILGTLFDWFVWFHVKDLKIFDENEENLVNDFLDKNEKEDTQTAEMECLKVDNLQYEIKR